VIRNFLDNLASDLILYAEFRLYQWLRRNTVDKLTFRSAESTDVDTGAAWQERRDAETVLCNYLDDTPSASHEILCQRVGRFTLSTASVAVIHGPQGSGKSRMLSRILQEKKRCVGSSWFWLTSFR
jgi:hypothetical protein